MRAQDWHFSQFQTNPMTVDPSLGGLHDGALRLSANYRNQWQFVARFNTLAMAIDVPLPQFKNQDYFAIGIQGLADRAGDLNYSTVQSGLNIAYHKSLNGLANHFLSAGFQAGMAYRSIDYTQINALDDEPAAILNRTNYNFLDYSAGLSWFYSPKRNENFYAGMGLFHIGNPNQAFSPDGLDPLAMKLSAYVGASLPLSQFFYFQPTMIHFRQGGQQSWNMGAGLRYWLNADKAHFQRERAIVIGTWYRYADAVVAYLRFDYKEFNFGFSYDINVSKLTAVSNSQGGPEISLIYILERSEGRRAQERQVTCPNFF
jgi:type IX secretion system PorP/SprF family membrane protein